MANTIDSTWDSNQSMDGRGFVHQVTRKVVLSIYIFFLLFQPPLFPVKTNVIMLVINLFVLFSISMINSAIRLPRRIVRCLVGFLPFFALLILLQISHCLIDGTNRAIYVSLIRSNVFLLFYAIVAVLTLIQLALHCKITYSDLIQYILIASFVQFACVVMSFCFPTIKQVFLRLIVNNSDNDTIIRAVEKGAVYRCFGFAENLFDAFGYIFSILISGVFLEGIEKRSVHYVASAFLLLFVPLVNARTGVILTGVGFLIILWRYSSIKVFAKIIVIVPVAFCVGKIILEHFPDTTRDWIMNGFEETRVLLGDGKTTGVYSEILSEDIVFPHNLFFGDGGTPESLAHFTGIDSGYVQCLWRYGIFGTFLLLGAYAHMFGIAFFATKNKKYRCLIELLVVIFFVYLVKLYSFTNYGAVFLVFGIPTMVIIQNDENGGSIIGN